jgi:hypothetical protein
MVSDIRYLHVHTGPQNTPIIAPTFVATQKTNMETNSAMQNRAFDIFDRENIID